MAIKEKTEEKPSRLVEYLRNEHVWENYALLILAIFTLLLGVLINNSTLIIEHDVPVLGGYSDILAWVLIILSSISIVLALYPFFKPAFPEFKKIQWLNKKMFLGNSIRVFIFLTTLSLLFLLYDAFISKIIALFLN